MSFIVKWILQRIGLAAVGATGGYAIVLFMALALGGGALVGYSLSSMIHDSAAYRADQDYQRQLVQLDGEIRQRDRQLIERKQQRDIITKEVVKYVPNPDTPDCGYSPERVQQFRQAAQEIFTAARRGNHGAGAADPPARDRRP